jgi:hypothetical protein
MVPVHVSTAARARAATAVLLVLLAWPVAHFALVERCGVSPEKLLGLARSCQPALATRTGIVAIQDGRRVNVPLRSLAEAPRRAYRRFVVDRHTLGSFTSPDALAQSVFLARPGLETVRVEVRESRLHGGRVTETLVPYEYRRGDVLLTERGIDRPGPG